jgi:hypothetical protein
MPEYRVRWEIDIDADNERDAAEKVRADYHTRITGASVYTVRGDSDELEARWRVIDLAGLVEEQFQWEFSHKALFRMAKRMVEEGHDLNDILYMLQKPWKYREVLTNAILEDEFNKVSPGADVPDPLME